MVRGARAADQAARELPPPQLESTRRRGVRQHYLLSGFARCAACGGSIQAVSRKSTTGRIFRYICSAYWNRGAAVCAKGRMAEMETADAAMRELVATEVLRPNILERALDRAVALLRTDDGSGTGEPTGGAHAPPGAA